MRLEPGRPASCIAVAAIGIATVLCGCGGAGGGSFRPNIGPLVGFAGWDSLSPTTCRGYVGSYFANAENVRVELWYATDGNERSTELYLGGVDEYPGSLTPFYAPPQMTNGEPRYPRVGRIRWNPGESGGPPRAPRFPLYANWCWTAPDSLRLSIENFGGWAYGVVVTLENRDGVRDFSPPLGHIAAGATWSPKSVARDSMGVLLAPIIVEMRWEDYSGIASRIVPLPTGIPPPQCN